MDWLALLRGEAGEKLINDERPLIPDRSSEERSVNEVSASSS
jgi:hypothetical protein